MSPSRGRGQVGLGAFQAFQHGLGVRHEDLRLRRQPHPPPRRLQQRHAHLAFQHRQLLGDGGGAVGQGGGDGGERSPVLQLTQQPESMEVEHRRTLQFS
ncbi:hypothetical protein HNR61_002206 [Actinomadura namibiensis]|uniref:Uncharacterized protein n=1 Tax=Actinomadura namibiensis TaxID=182080 RepID=A0A7W3QL43_ACTNM|nr:hypothetical protein [Actinomadura namibiensis]